MQPKGVKESRLPKWMAKYAEKACRTLHKKQLRGHKGVVSYVESTSDTKKHVQEALDKELEEDGFFIDHPKKPENANFVIATGWVTGRLDGRAPTVTELSGVL